MVRQLRTLAHQQSIQEQTEITWSALVRQAVADVLLKTGAQEIK
jgi:hypothetical protein